MYSHKTIIDKTILIWCSLNSILFCKAKKRQYLITCKVSRYCLSALQCSLVIIMTDTCLLKSVTLSKYMCLLRSLKGHSNDVGRTENGSRNIYFSEFVGENHAIYIKYSTPFGSRNNDSHLVTSVSDNRQ